MTGIIILAAGASTRLGRPKQTLDFQQKSLVKHAINSALNSQLGPVIVVIGANEKEVLLAIENEPVVIAINSNWKDGMSSSIQAGLIKLLQENNNIDDVILMVCDQPHVSETILKNLVDTKRSANKPIVACSYRDAVGVPALFDHCFFSALLSLTGEEGGKKILLNNSADTAVILFPGGSVDIDTMEDYEALVR